MQNWSDSFWLECDSAPPNNEIADIVRTFLANLVDNNVALPVLFPLVDAMFSEESEYEDVLGGLTCEWSSGVRVVSINFINDGTYECYALLEDGSNISFSGKLNEHTQLVCIDFILKNWA